ncbi:MAG: hypothetical protein AABX37_05520 [Nanoarchaeota archaeon]
MNKMAYKVGAGIVTASLLLSSVTTSAFADLSAEISENGAGSHNSIYIKQKNECSVYQKNKTEVLTEVESQANTGGNTANGNTGGDVTVNTGNATSTVTVQVDGGSNIATNPCCCECQTCDLHLWGQGVVISGNGEDSVSSVTVKKKKSSSVKQKNETSVLTAVLSKAKTGKNKAKYNTNGSVEIKTGKAESTVDVSVTSSSNTLF